MVMPSTDHAPQGAQKNSDILQSEIEAKLTGQIASHTHAGGGGGDMTKAVYDPNLDNVIAKAQLDADLANTSGTNTGDQTLAGLGGIAHSLALAINDFLVASGAGVFVKKTLAEVRTILDWAADIATHAALTTGTHGVGVSTVESISGSQAKVDAHKDLATGVHGAGASTIETIAGSQGKVDTHAGAADPHTGYQQESEKGAVSGYAGLDAGTKVPTAQLGGAGADATKYLRGDQSWQVPAGGGTLPTPIDITLLQVYLSASGTTWTNMPAALTEMMAGYFTSRTKIDLTNASQSRVIVRIASLAPVANAQIKIQYSTDETTWVDLCPVTMPATANTTNVGVWTDVPAGAKADVVIRVAGMDGDGVTDPTFSSIHLQVK